jgi:Hint domain
VSEPIECSTQIESATRRTLLTRDLKAICALAALTLIEQLTLPNSASAHDYGYRGDGGRHGDDGRGAHHHGGDHDGGHHHGGDHDGHGDHGGGHGQCFLRGTRILTATGERRVEDLKVGDLVPTVFGGTRPIQWIGRFRRVRRSAGKPWPRDARPVRIAASALAPNVPHADLYVTQGHALLFDDILIPAGCLVNDSTISIYPADELDQLEFLHLKLETHDVVYAEGAPCETLLRVDETMSNFADYFRSHGAAEAKDRHCAPLLCNGPRAELRTRARSLLSPWLGLQRFDDVRMRLELQALADRHIKDPQRR